MEMNNEVRKLVKMYERGVLSLEELRVCLIRTVGIDEADRITAPYECE